MKRTAMLAYGAVNYLMFLAVFLYLAGFLLNWGVPKSIDSGPSGPLVTAVGLNALLITLFGLQHSIMARPWFKKLLTKFVPPQMERSTYVLFSNLILMLLFWQWRPIPSLLWNFEQPISKNISYILFLCGIIIIPAVTFVINHFDLFGLRQVWLNYRGRSYNRLHFVTPGPYRLVRHPLYVGWIVMFWATPALSVGHFLFAALMTAYILVAIVFEEKNLIEEFAEYKDYKKRTPMLIPRIQGILRGATPG